MTISPRPFLVYEILDGNSECLPSKGVESLLARSINFVGW